MLVVIGNLAPGRVQGGVIVPLDHGGICVTTVAVPDDYTITDDGSTGAELLAHLAMNREVTHLPDHEAFVNLMNVTSGVLRDHMRGPAEFVEVRGQKGDEERATILERQLVEAFNTAQRASGIECKHGTPDDLEDRYHTVSGPPGVGPPSIAELTDEPISPLLQGLLEGDG